MGRLTGKNILITGGNSGIGLATAQEFDREGARVAICGLNERTLQAAKGTLGAGSLAVRADVSKLADLDTMFATIKREFGHLDGLFVNAGYSEFLPFEEVTEQSFDMVIGSNFKGAYFTIQKALPLLRPGSSVVINASVGARKGWPTTSTVSTCKAAVVHLARILSAELVGRGIRVNTLSPGPTDTAMFGRFAGEEQGDAVKPRDFAAWLGLVPKQISTGDRTILGRITKRGNRYLRTLFMQGARVILLRPANWAKHSFGLWLRCQR